MLKRIKLQNFTTYIKPTVIDFGATNYKFLENENVGRNRVLKGCLFVGENASGKTMILKSIKLMLDLLFNNNDPLLENYASFYSEDLTYSLEYVFDILDKEVTYSFEIVEENIVSEKLLVDKVVILERLGNFGKLYLSDEKCFSDLSSNLLFLRRVYFDTKFYGNEVLTKWFEFLKNSTYVDCYSRRVISYSGNSLLVHENLNDDMINQINGFMDKINYKQKINLLNVENGNGYTKLIVFERKGTKVFVTEGHESLGNKTLIEVLPAFLHSIKYSGMIILDEFSSGLHNELEECLVKYFFHYAKDSQLFFTSHSTNLLNNAILRPDQIYSTEFSNKNGTMLKRFSEEMPRESQNTERMYLNGVFNGLPRYNKKFKD